MRHATTLLYHVCAVASRNIRFASCGTNGKLTLLTRYVMSLLWTTIDGVWIGNQINWTRKECNYNEGWWYHCLHTLQFTIAHTLVFSACHVFTSPLVTTYTSRRSPSSGFLGCHKHLQLLLFTDRVTSCWSWCWSYGRTDSRSDSLYWCLASIWFPFFKIITTFYLQSVPVHLANCVKTYTMACKRMLSSAPL
jgi:hypothetical protein